MPRAVAVVPLVPLVPLVLLAACASDVDVDGLWSDCPRAAGFVDPTGTVSGYVIDSLDLPSDENEAFTFGLAVDHWRKGVLFGENVVGALIGDLGERGYYDADGEARVQLDAGEGLELLELQTTSTVDATDAGLRFGLGVDLDGDPTDNFSGGEPFRFDPAAPIGVTAGAIQGSLLDAISFGTETRIGVALPGMDQPLILPLIEPRIVGTATPTEMTALIGGGIPADAVEASLLPALRDGLTALIARDCPGGTCQPDSPGAHILRDFDADADGAITIAELQLNRYFEHHFVPDLDLRIGPAGAPVQCTDTELDADGNDALSIGFRFHAVRAVLQ